MFDWLKRLLSDPPAASLPGDIANPPTVYIHPDAMSIRAVANPSPVVEQSEDERIEKAKKLLDEAIYTLWGCGVSYFDMEGMISDALDRYSDDDDEDEDEWFSDEDDDDDCDDYDDDDHSDIEGGPHDALG